MNLLSCEFELTAIMILLVVLEEKVGVGKELDSDWG